MNTTDLSTKQWILINEDLKKAILFLCLGPRTGSMEADLHPQDPYINIIKGKEEPQMYKTTI